MKRGASGGGRKQDRDGEDGWVPGRLVWGAGAATAMRDTSRSGSGGSPEFMLASPIRGGRLADPGPI